MPGHSWGWTWRPLVWTVIVTASAIHELDSRQKRRNQEQVEVQPRERGSVASVIGVIGIRGGSAFAFRGSGHN